MALGICEGLCKRIPELKALGIDFIWLNPVYASPNVDNGYDISDFRAIHPDFGTMEDMDELINLAHEYEIKLIMDLVVNHTSDQHPWFQEAQKVKTILIVSFIILSMRQKILPQMIGKVFWWLDLDLPRTNQASLFPYFRSRTTGS